MGYYCKTGSLAEELCGHDYFTRAVAGRPCLWIS